MWRQQYCKILVLDLDLVQVATYQAVSSITKSLPCLTRGFGYGPRDWNVSPIASHEVLCPVPQPQSLSDHQTVPAHTFESNYSRYLLGQLYPRLSHNHNEARDNMAGLGQFTGSIIHAAYAGASWSNFGQMNHDKFQPYGPGSRR